jgi:ssDNA-binding Zn-finger/Zn-ribbon topoisomerase 1
MGVSRYERQVNCRCGKGQLLVEFAENDHPYGNWWESTEVLKQCPACGSNKLPKPTKKQLEWEREETRRLMAKLMEKGPF